MKFTALATLVAYVSAECPNACSGHGTCGQKDQCSCYNNYQGNDCSERTCYFGIAFVDTPKGDLNADGLVSGPLTTVITGSEVYPWGTTEQYPNADANEGHFYMECSNKGLCDRKSGECECFDGYEGTACIRASCPNDCSGHGTCESIKEFAEMKIYDTNAQDVPTTTPVGSNDHHNFDSNIEESYTYDLWDADKTMGCLCDPVYYGADCSLKKCKYGVDPLYFDDFDGVIFQSTIVHLGSVGTAAVDTTLQGTFKIDFYDVFGEKYTTKPLPAVPGSAQQSMGKLTATKVAEAFGALPNDVISSTNTDVTRVTSQPPVRVSMQNKAGDVEYKYSLGAGAQGNDGAGIGGIQSRGPEFTVTFDTNPGILKTIELDTRQISSVGTPDYWVANMRQGQFSSRYTTKADAGAGRVNTLLYGSKYLYTNVLPASVVEGESLLKVNGAEYLAAKTSTDEKMITLNEPFLGASIVPMLTDTGAVATAIDTAEVDDVINSYGFILDADKGVTSSNTDALSYGAALYTQSQPFTVALDFVANPDTTTAAVGSVTMNQELLTTESIKNTKFFFEVSTPSVIYRRSDDPDNQNFYQADKDSGVLASETWCGTRGRHRIYACAINAKSTESYKSPKLNDVADLRLTVAADASPALVADHGLFVGINGPYRIEAVDTASITIDSYDNNFPRFSDHFTSETDDQAMVAPMWTTADSSDVIGRETLMLANGRRYKAAPPAPSDTDGDERLTPSTTRSYGDALLGSSLELTETFAGPALRKLCTACVAAIATGAIVMNTGSLLSLEVGDALLIGSDVTYDAISYVNAAFDGMVVDQTISVDTPIREPVDNVDQDLFILQGTYGFLPVWVTESATQTTYQYVSQCGNRGNCDSSTGLCTCFKGYTNDNCDTQNMLAV